MCGSNLLVEAVNSPQQKKPKKATVQTALIGVSRKGPKTPERNARLLKIESRVTCCFDRLDKPY